MLRGAIEVVHPHRVGGWIHCSLGSVAEQTVLAFVGGVCVGAGRIDRPREDLKRAGLGDGALGFSFPIKLADEADVEAVVVKLEGSDLALLQKDARVARRRPAPTLLAEPQRVEWLRRRGVLGASELLFLKSLQKMGVVDHSLVLPCDAARSKPEIADPGETAQGLFEMLALQPVELKQMKLSVCADAEIVAAASEAGAALPVAAIHARAPGVFAVVEGSHVLASPPGALEAAIDYGFGPDQLLFVDLNTRFAAPDGKAADVSVFIAAR